MDAAQRALLNFLAGTEGLTPDLSPDKALAALVESLLFELDRLDGADEVAESIDAFFALDFSAAEVEAACNDLILAGRVVRVSSHLELDVSARAEIAEASRAVVDRQERALQLWGSEVAEHHPTVAVADLQNLEADLLIFLRKVCSLHGAATALLLHPDSAKARELMAAITEPGAIELPRRESALEAIRSVELSRFLEVSDLDRRLFLADLLNAWAALSVVTVDPRASQLISSVTRGQVAYTDTNFLYRLFGFNGPLEKAAAKELVALGVGLGYHFRVTPWTIDEFRVSVARARDFLRNHPAIPANLEMLAIEQSETDVISAYWRAHRDRGVGIDTFFAFWDSLEDLVAEYGIAVASDGCVAVDANREAIDEQMVLLDRVLIGYRHEAVKEHDAKHRLLVRRLRGGRRDSFANAGFFYLTCDGLMPSFDRAAQEYEKVAELPFAILASAFLQVIRLLVPRTENLDLSLADMVASPHLRSVTKMDSRTTALVLARVAEYENYTPELAAKVLMNQAFVRAVEGTREEKQQLALIDAEVVKSAETLAEDMKKIGLELSRTRSEYEELKKVVSRLEGESSRAEAERKQALTDTQERSVEDKAQIGRLSRQLLWARASLGALIWLATAALVWVWVPDLENGARALLIFAAAVLAGLGSAVVWGWKRVKTAVWVVELLVAVFLVIWEVTMNTGGGVPPSP